MAECGLTRPPWKRRHVAAVHTEQIGKIGEECGDQAALLFGREVAAAPFSQGQTARAVGFRIVGGVRSHETALKAATRRRSPYKPDGKQRNQGLVPHPAFIGAIRG